MYYDYRQIYRERGLGAAVPPNKVASFGKFGSIFAKYLLCFVVIALIAFIVKA